MRRRTSLRTQHPDKSHCRWMQLPTGSIPMLNNVKATTDTFIPAELATLLTAQESAYTPNITSPIKIAYIPAAVALPMSSTYTSEKANICDCNVLMKPHIPTEVLLYVGAFNRPKLTWLTAKPCYKALHCLRAQCGLYITKYGMDEMKGRVTSSYDTIKTWRKRTRKKTATKPQQDCYRTATGQQQDCNPFSSTLRRTGWQMRPYVRRLKK